MNIETGTMNRTISKKVIVPDSSDIAAMRDDELMTLRDELNDAKLAIEAQLSAAKTSGNIDPEWLRRTNGALTHMRRGLTAIKQERERRSLVVKIPNDLTPAFDAIDTLRDVLKAYAVLVDAVRRFLDDDNDDNFDALERLVTS